MFKALKYVLTENFTNLYRIYSVAKYDIKDDVQSSKLGMAWKFLSPIIQVLIFWAVFGLMWDKKPPVVEGVAIPYLPWLTIGYACWWFIQPVISKGCMAIKSKISIVENMIFPVSTLPAICVCKEFFDSLFVIILGVFVVLLYGIMPSVWWLQIPYYMFATFCLGEAITMILSVLTMKLHDVSKLVTSLIRGLFYFSPVIWDCHTKSHTLNMILKLNPCYYLINGYRESMFYGVGFWEHKWQTMYFWVLVVVLFCIGCVLMYKNKEKYIDLK